MIMIRAQVLIGLLIATALLWAGPVPEDKDIDWGEKITKKQTEVEDLLAILGPVVTYISESMEAGRTNEMIEEEWLDAGAQLGDANKMYDECKERIAKKEESKELFLLLENAWQIYVKAGVAGMRAKTMIDVLPQ
jgi:hypothetical protein